MPTVANGLLAALRWFDIDEPYIDEPVPRGKPEYVRPFVAAAIRDRRRWYGLAVISALVSAYAIAPWLVPGTFLQLSGLFLDIAGACFVGIGLLRSDVGIERDAMAISTNKTNMIRFGKIEQESHDTFSHERDPLSISSEARDTVDATAGIILLIVGFGLQVFAVLL